MTCIESLAVKLQQNDDSDVTVVIDNDSKVTYNGKLLTEHQLKYSSAADSYTTSSEQEQFVVVRRLSTLFISIRGFGFQVLYDVNGRISITMEPFYARQVRRCLLLFSVDVIITVVAKVSVCCGAKLLYKRLDVG